MLRWPKEAFGAIRAFFAPLQTIDVYVEDQNDEAFYSELFRRIAPEGVRFQRVIALNGRANVLLGAAGYDFTRRAALFLVDGDFEWVRGDSAPHIPGVYRLECYCIENLLICSVAAARVLMESCECTEEDAHKLLQIDQFEAQFPALVELCTAWAAVNRHHPMVPTISTGLGSMLDGSSKVPTLDTTKVAAVTKKAEALLVGSSAQADLDAIRGRVAGLSDPALAVSGKDLLLPLLWHHLHSITKHVPRMSQLRFRLALHAELQRFGRLSQALRDAALDRNQHW